MSAGVALRLQDADEMMRACDEAGVKLFVVKKDPTLTADALLAHCREQLTGYKCPRDVEFRTELPKSNVGKILRRELRDEAKKKAA